MTDANPVYRISCNEPGCDNVGMLCETGELINWLGDHNDLHQRARCGFVEGGNPCPARVEAVVIFGKQPAGLIGQEIRYCKRHALFIMDTHRWATKMELL